jgi:hypothetical protein
LGGDRISDELARPESDAGLSGAIDLLKLKINIFFSGSAALCGVLGKGN